MFDRGRLKKLGSRIQAHSKKYIATSSEYDYVKNDKTYFAIEER